MCVRVGPPLPFRLPPVRLGGRPRPAIPLPRPQLVGMSVEVKVCAWTEPSFCATHPLFALLAGVVGALKGAGRGLLDLNYRPVKGLALSVEALERMVVRE